MGWGTPARGSIGVTAICLGAARSLVVWLLEPGVTWVPLASGPGLWLGGSSPPGYVGLEDLRRCPGIREARGKVLRGLGHNPKVLERQPADPLLVVGKNHLCLLFSRRSGIPKC